MKNFNAYIKVLLENALSDIDVVKSSARYQDSDKIYGRPIGAYLDLLQTKYGFHFKKFLGGGEFGVAFLTDDNKTVKITRDRSEVVEAFKYKNSHITAIHLPKVYNTMKLKVGTGEDATTIYVIVKDFILQNPALVNLLDNIYESGDMYRNKFNELFPEFRHYTGMDLQDFITDSIVSAHNEEYEIVINKFIEFLNENNRKKEIWYIQQLREIGQEVLKYGMQSFDFHNKNLGIKNKKLIYLDAGNGDYFGPIGQNKQEYDAELAEIFST